MNTFVQSITYPPVAFLLGVVLAAGIAWIIRKAESRELVNKMMRRREFEFAGRTWIAYAQGMTAREKREWARKLNKQMPPKPGPRLPPWAAGHNPPPPKSGRPEPPPARDVRGKRSVDVTLRTNDVTMRPEDWEMLEFRRRFRMWLQHAGLPDMAVQTWDKAVYHAAEGLYGLRDAQRIIAQQFARGTLDRDELLSLHRLCPTLFRHPEQTANSLYAHHGAPADELRGMVDWGASALAAPPPGAE